MVEYTKPDVGQDPRLLCRWTSGSHYLLVLSTGPLVVALAVRSFQTFEMLSDAKPSTSLFEAFELKRGIIPD